MSTLLNSRLLRSGDDTPDAPPPATWHTSTIEVENDLTGPDGYSTWDMPPLRNEDSYRLISLFAPVAGIEEKDLLQASIGRERFFWSEPNNHQSPLTIVGVGIAAELRVAPVLDIEEYTAQLPGHRFQAIHVKANCLFNRAIMLCIHDATNTESAIDYSLHPARPRLLGGFAFQDDFIPDNTWSVFNPAHFVLPHFQWTR